MFSFQVAEATHNDKNPNHKLAPSPPARKGEPVRDAIRVTEKTSVSKEDQAPMRLHFLSPHISWRAIRRHDHKGTKVLRKSILDRQVSVSQREIGVIFWKASQT